MVDYDVIIIGAGPAGMNACLYATRSNLKTLVIEKSYPGGKIVKTSKILNWLGTESVEGPELALQMFKHSFSYGGVYEQGNVIDIIDHKEYKEVVVENKKYKCYAVIICSGMSERKIGIPGEEKFYGKGVSYCAICDGSLYKGKKAVVVGNSEQAMHDVTYLSKILKEVVWVNDKVNSEHNLDEIKELDNITIYKNAKIQSINGTSEVTSVTLEIESKEITIETDVVFPLLGSIPDSMFATRLNLVDNKNYIIVNDKQETAISGIYAAGDCTNNALKQIITASSGGAIAAIEAYKYIGKNKKRRTI